MLTVINGYTHFALQALEPGDALRADLQQVADAGRRAAD